MLSKPQLTTELTPDFRENTKFLLIFITVVSKSLFWPCGSKLAMEDFSGCSEVIRREVKYLIVFINEYPGLRESYNKESPETRLLEYVQLFEEDDRELEDTLGEKSVDGKNTDHVKDHNAEIDTLVHSSNAPEFKGALSSLFSVFVKAGNREEDSAKQLRVTTLHTGKS